jgi:hypothetical protein
VETYSSDPRATRLPRDWEETLLSYAELHYFVQFSAELPGAPFDLVGSAAKWVATGIVQRRPALERLGRDVVRYQIWRGKSNLRAFVFTRGRIKKRLLEQAENALAVPQSLPLPPPSADAEEDPFTKYLREHDPEWTRQWAKRVIDALKEAREEQQMKGSIMPRAKKGEERS